MRILIVDDHEVVRRGVRSLLLSGTDCEVCGEAVDGQDAITKARELKPDVIVMDISMPRLNGLEATREIRRDLPQIEILIMSQHDSPQMMREALNMGARGYVVKSSISTNLLAALEKVRQGEPYFDPSITGKSAGTLDAQEILQRSMAFEKALRESEERFRVTFEQAAVGMAHMAEDGRWLRVNRKLCEIVGYMPEELLKLTFQHITHPADLSADLMQAARLARGQIDDYSMEKRYLRKDGSVVWINLTCAAVRDGQGKLKYFISVIEDISARKNAETRQQQAAQQQQAVFDLVDEMHRAASSDEVHHAAFNAIFSALRCDRAAIVLRDERRAMRFATSRGLSEEYRNAVDAHPEWRRDDVDPRPACRGDIRNANMDESFKAAIVAEGIAASMAIPLITNGNLIGKFLAYFNAPHDFSRDEIELSLTIARQLAFGIEKKRAEEALSRSEEQFRELSNWLDELRAQAEQERRRIESSEERLRLAQSAAQIGTWECDPVNDTRNLSSELHRIFGTDPQDPEFARKWAEWIHPEDRQKVQQVMEDGHRAGNMEFEYRYCHPELGLRWFYCKGSRVRDESRMFGVILDITKRKQAEEDLRRIQGQLEATSDHLEQITSKMVAVSRVSRDLRYLWVNQAYADWMQQPLHEIVGKRVEEMLGAEALAKLRPYFERALAGEKLSYEEEVTFPEIGARWISTVHTSAFDRDGEPDGWIAVIEDVTERKRAEDALRQSEERYRALADRLEIEVRARAAEMERQNTEVVRQAEELRELSGRLMRTQDDERRRIARELHDSAGQTITALGMTLGRIGEVSKGRDLQVHKEVEGGMQFVQQLAQEIRTTSYLLHPPLLDETGLSEALSTYIDGIQQRSDLQIQLDVPEDFGRLPRDLELSIFRIVQECLTNIHRHSGSKSARIGLSRSEQSIQLEVQDFGKGISPERLADIQAQRSGVGIRGMRERVRQFQGDMKFESNGGGTRISVYLPLEGIGTTQAENQNWRIEMA